jgi:DNA helicase MCM8
MTLTQRLRAAARRYGSDPLPPALLRKYIAYARCYCKPRLTVEAARVLQTLYLVMRSEAAGGRSMPITTRQLESLVRLSQARAKADLREEVTAQDAKDVVDMMQVRDTELNCTDVCVHILLYCYSVKLLT